MNIAVLQRELDELQRASTLFEARNFRARKEALDFTSVIEKISAENYRDNAEALFRLRQQARELGERVHVFNRAIARDWYARLKSGRPAPQELRNSLQPYSDYVPLKWGTLHYGYENLDFLLEEILLPQPHPQAALDLEQGMVRYEPTPASVILELTERITFTDDDVFYDLGSGLGKVILLVHLLTNTRCVGVEYQSDFCRYADQKAHELNLAGVRYINADARYADYADATVFFFFNPFGGVIFPAVLERLHQEAQHRDIRICSYGSSTLPLSELPWLEYLPPRNEDAAALAIFRSRSC